MSPAKAAQIAAMHAANRPRTDAKVEDLEWLVSFGEDLERACARVGWTPNAALKALQRRDHPLRNAVQTLVSEQRRAAA